MSPSYAARIKKILPADLRRLFSRLDSPSKIQNYLDTLPINFEVSEESNASPIDVFRMQSAHCFEGAVFAAAALAFHGHKPSLMDFATAYDDEDHTVALFRRGAYWGAISKTNHAVLRFRDPIYRSPRELAMSYVHEFYMPDGRKSLRGYSRPFDLSRYPPETWCAKGKSLDWLMVAIARTWYFPVVPDHFARHLRHASNIELNALQISDFPDPRSIR